MEKEKLDEYLAQYDDEDEGVVVAALIIMAAGVGISLILIASMILFNW